MLRTEHSTSSEIQWKSTYGDGEDGGSVPCRGGVETFGRIPSCKATISITKEVIAKFNRIFDEFLTNQSEKVIDSLLKCLALLTSTVNPSSLNVECLETAKLFVNVHRLMKGSPAQPTAPGSTALLWSAVAFLEEIVKCSNLRTLLVNRFKFMQIFGKLLESVSNPDRCLSILRLVENLSYDIRIGWQETYLSGLIKALTDIIISSEDSTTTDDNRKYSVDERCDCRKDIAFSILINLCYRNVQAQYVLQRTVNMDVLLNKMRNCGSDECGILYLKIKFIMERNFLETSVEEVYELIGSIFKQIRDAIRKLNFTALYHAIDFFKDFNGNSNQSEQHIANFASYEEHIAELCTELENLNKNKSSILTASKEMDIDWPKCVSEILMFFKYLLSQYDGPKWKLRKLLIDFAKSSLMWIDFEMTSLQACELLIEILQQRDESDVMTSIVAATSKRLLCDDQRKNGPHLAEANGNDFEIENIISDRISGMFFILENVEFSPEYMYVLLKLIWQLLKVPSPSSSSLSKNANNTQPEKKHTPLITPAAMAIINNFILEHIFQISRSHLKTFADLKKIQFQSLPITSGSNKMYLAGLLVLQEQQQSLMQKLQRADTSTTFGKVVAISEQKSRSQSALLSSSSSSSSSSPSPSSSSLCSWLAEILGNLCRNRIIQFELAKCILCQDADICSEVFQLAQLETFPAREVSKTMVQQRIPRNAMDFQTDCNAIAADVTREESNEATATGNTVENPAAKRQLQFHQKQRRTSILHRHDSRECQKSCCCCDNHTVSLERRADDLIQQITDAHHKGEIANVLVSDVMKLLELRTEMYSKKEKDFLAQLDESNSQVTSLSHNVAVLSTELTQHQALNYSLQMNVDGMKVEMTDLVEKNSNFAKAVKILEQKVEKAKLEHDDVINQCTHTQSVISELNKKLASASGEIRQKDAILPELREQLSVERQKVKDLKEQVINLNRFSSQLEKQITRRETHSRDLRKRAKCLAKKNTQLSEKLIQTEVLLAQKKQLLANSARDLRDVQKIRTQVMLLLQQQQQQQQQPKGQNLGHSTGDADYGGRC